MKQYTGAYGVFAVVLFVLAGYVFAQPLQTQPQQSQQAQPGKLIPAEKEKIIRGLSGSFVKVLYTLKADKGIEPEIPGLVQLCPSCGQFHPAGDGEKFLDEERPFQTGGYLVEVDRVITADMMIPPRFVEKIEVKFGEKTVPAKITAYGVGASAVMLSLEGTLGGAVPLKFEPTVQNLNECLLITYDILNASWQSFIGEIIETAAVDENGTGYQPARTFGIAVSQTGTPATLIMNSRIPTDNSWSKPPSQWSWTDLAGYQRAIDKLRNITDGVILRAKLNFRSPRKSSLQDRFFYRDRDEDEMNIGQTEMDVAALAVETGSVLVLANMDAKTTARLEKITVYTADGTPLAAKFSGTLSDYGAFLATLEKPLLQTVEIAGGSVLDYGNTMLLAADVSIRGDNKVVYPGHRRIASFKTGWHNQIYINAPPSENEVFLFNSQGKLVALPIARRMRIPSQDRWDTEMDRNETLTWAGYIGSVMSNIAANIDSNNIPLSEAQENKLAWMGVELQPLDRELARINKVSDLTRDGRTGALVSYVYPDSPAAAAGIEPGVVLLRLYIEKMPKPVEIEAEETDSYMSDIPFEKLGGLLGFGLEEMPPPWPLVNNRLNRTITDIGFGRKYSAEFARAGEVFRKDFTAEESHTYYESAQRYKSETIGMTVRDITFEVNRFFQRTPDEPGVIVSRIEKGQKAAVAGILPFEIITHINDQPVPDVKTFEKLVAGADELKLSVKRKMVGRVVKIKTGAVQKSPGDSSTQDKPAQVNPAADKPVQND